MSHDDAVHGSEAITQDVNTDEALSVSNATMNAMTQMNMKRTYDLHQTLDTDAILASRRQADAEANMRLRHAEDSHKQAMRHAETEHVIKVHTLSVSSVGNSKIVENIATDTADQIVTMARAKLGK